MKIVTIKMAWLLYWNPGKKNPQEKASHMPLSDIFPKIKYICDIYNFLVQKYISRALEYTSNIYQIYNILANIYFIL